MLKKNSVFIKILIPVTVVMLFQSLLISLVLFANGTISSLEDDAITTMSKNAENRAINLENMMVYYWSNLDKLEIDITTEFADYLTANELSAEHALGNARHKTNMLHNMSEALLNTLRTNASTGVFIYFVDDINYYERDIRYNGIYYRDLDPLVTPADYSDVLFLRGDADIAQKDKIQLDSLWNETFYFSPEYDGTWQSFSKPLLAVLQNPRTASRNLSYWSLPLSITPWSALDSNKCITYTRPVLFNGQLIAMIGTEVQLSQLEKLFPPNDYDNSGRSGYMLIKYTPHADGIINADIYSVTGSYMKRIIGHKADIILTPTHRDGVYTPETSGIAGVQVLPHSLRIYNTNASYRNEQWALAAIGTNELLFETSTSIVRGILFSSIIAFIAGCVLLAVVIRHSTRPLLTFVEQIEHGEPDSPIELSVPGTYELALLRDTINAMKCKRRDAEIQTREERERYLLALESAADTFMEYDIAKDSFMLYYFFGQSRKQELGTKVIERFSEEIRAEKFSHPDDIDALTAFLNSQDPEPIEIRAAADVFSHIKTTTDDGYYWFLLRAAHICGENGTIEKVIGTAKNITAEKLKEFASIEAERRDMTTGFYKRLYGLQLLKNLARNADKTGNTYVLALIHIDSHDKFEAYYGRTFGGVIARNLCNLLRTVMDECDNGVRLSNDDFMIMLNDIKSEDVMPCLERIRSDALLLYAGENAELCLNVSIGAASGTGGFDDSFKNAYRAAVYSVRSGGGLVSYYDALPMKPKTENWSWNEKPVEVELDISLDGIVGFVFELFEHTSDVRSAVNILLAVLGDMFSLRRIILCSYDADFRANQVLFQWSATGRDEYHYKIEKIPYEAFNVFDSRLDENGALLYTDEIFKNTPELNTLLCAVPGEKINAYCCAMYENSMHTGRAIFVSADNRRIWTEADMYSLYEITKILAAHLSVDRSNSANRAKSEFLSRISHEIRTPMNAILGMTDIAKDSIYDPARVSDCLNKIDFSAKHLLTIINDVLEMSRIESGRLEIRIEYFDINDLVSGINTLMRRAIEDNGLTFVINNNCEHTAVSGDEYRLRQVIVNLLGNAAKFTAPGGKIEFSISQVASDGNTGQFRFSVKDNGIGISREEQPRVFKAFEQASSNYKRQGTGLGLAISGSIISAMGGKIELKSNLGEGSEFYFTIALKLEEYRKSAADDIGEVDYSKYLSGKKVLLAEDNDINAEIALCILNEAGMKIELASNGQIAVDKFFESAPGEYDIIIMDIQMPIMDGLTAARNIRKNSERFDAREIPIIAMTANAFDEDTKKSIDSGMNGHIAKPIDKKKLYSLIKQCLTQK